MNKRRHRELQKKRKAYKSRKKKDMQNIITPNLQYMFQEYHVNCGDALSLMTPADGRIYRLAHNPNQEIDIYPTSLWDYESLTPIRIEQPVTIPPNSSIEEQIEHIREYTPSFNISIEGVIKPFIPRFEKMKTFSQFNKFKDRKGSHIYAYDVKPIDGKMMIESDGHVSFLPYEGFTLEEHIAKEFTPIPIENYNKNINNLH